MRLHYTNLYNPIFFISSAEWIWRSWQRYWWDLTGFWTSCSADNFTYSEFLLKKNISCFFVLPCAFIDLSIVSLSRVQIFFYSTSCFVFLTIVSDQKQTCKWLGKISCFIVYFEHSIFVENFMNVLQTTSMKQLRRRL